MKPCVPALVTANTTKRARTNSVLLLWAQKPVLVATLYGVDLHVASTILLVGTYCTVLLANSYSVVGSYSLSLQLSPGKAVQL